MEASLATISAYLAILIVFGVVDALWLSVMGPLLYKPTLGEILLENLKIAPAAVFYLLFPIGVFFFGTMPALRSGAVATALLHGALFGAFAYATYDLTNYATLRNWTLQITVLDITYGALASGLAAAAGFYAARMAQSMFGGS
jgi:uncharacterized membrane protein